MNELVKIIGRKIKTQGAVINPISLSAESKNVTPHIMKTPFVRISIPMLFPKHGCFSIRF